MPTPSKHMREASLPERLEWVAAVPSVDLKVVSLRDEEQLALNGTPLSCASNYGTIPTPYSRKNF
jgi:hypothetical protein